MSVWIVLNGGGVFHRGATRESILTGDVALIPADSADIEFEAGSDCDVLEVLVPIPSTPSPDGG